MDFWQLPIIQTTGTRGGYQADMPANYPARWASLIITGPDGIPNHANTIVITRNGAPQPAGSIARTDAQVAAFLLQRFPNLTLAELKQRLKAGMDD